MKEKNFIKMFIPIFVGILVFPFTMYWKFESYQFIFHDLCTFPLPDFDVLLPYYGVVLSIAFSLLIHYLEKTHSDRIEWEKYMREHAPGLGIELYELSTDDPEPHGDEEEFYESNNIDSDYAYRLLITNRKDINCTIENIESTPVTINLISKQTHTAFLLFGSPTRSTNNCIYITNDSNLNHGYPKTLNLTVIDDDNNHWNCFYQSYEDYNKIRYRLSHVERTLTCKISEELIEK